jgi:hypothetical protein
MKAVTADAATPTLGQHSDPAVLDVFPDDSSRGDQMTNRPTSKGVRPAVDLTQVAAVPWAWVDEHLYAAIRGCSVKVLQNERRLNIGCPFRRINGTTIRYKFGDIQAFLESQPGGGGGAQPRNSEGRGPGRRRKSLALTVAAD